MRRIADTAGRRTRHRNAPARRHRNLVVASTGPRRSDAGDPSAIAIGLARRECIQHPQHHQLTHRGSPLQPGLPGLFVRSRLERPSPIAQPRERPALRRSRRPALLRRQHLIQLAPASGDQCRMIASARQLRPSSALASVVGISLPNGVWLAMPEVAAPNQAGMRNSAGAPRNQSSFSRLTTDCIGAAACRNVPSGPTSRGPGPRRFRQAADGRLGARGCTTPCDRGRCRRRSPRQHFGATVRA